MTNLFEAGSSTRRMPVYLLLDVSGSMAGDAIQSLEVGLQMLNNELNAQPQAVELVHISVITFASSASQVVPLTPLTSFVPPSFAAGGQTSLGAAFRTLGSALDREVVANVPGVKKGDFKPLVFLLTDGEPTDNWESELNALNNRRDKKIGSIIALGCGGQVNVAVLKKITSSVLLVADATPDNLKQFFKWVSASISTASKKASGAGGGEAGATLPPPPAGFQIPL